MKILQIVLIAAALVACSCDPVSCVEVQNSVRGYYTSCSSTQPWPLKVSTTIKLMQNYTFTATYSWKFYLRDYRGQITTIANCGLNNPSNGPRVAGAQITVGFQCFEAQRQLQQGDAIQIVFFDDFYFDKLTFVIPIIGYTTQEQIQQIQKGELNIMEQTLALQNQFKLKTFLRKNTPLKHLNIA